MLSSIPQVCIVGAARTPMGSFMGSLSSLSATQLGAIAIRGPADVEEVYMGNVQSADLGQAPTKFMFFPPFVLAEAVGRSGLGPADVEEVYMGNVLSADLGQAPARQAALGAGLPDSVVATTVNKRHNPFILLGLADVLKLSCRGMTQKKAPPHSRAYPLLRAAICLAAQAIMLGLADVVVAGGIESHSSICLAAQAIMLGLADVVVAGGMESMSNAPYYLNKARAVCGGAWHWAGAAGQDSDGASTQPVFPPATSAPSPPCRNTQPPSSRHVKQEWVLVQAWGDGGRGAERWAESGYRFGHGEMVDGVQRDGLSDAYSEDPMGSGYRFGHGEMVDGVQRDGLSDAYSEDPMGCFAEQCAEEHGIAREQQDEHATATHERAAAAHADGAFDWEIVPVEVKASKGKQTILVERDEPCAKGVVMGTMGGIDREPEALLFLKGRSGVGQCQQASPLAPMLPVHLQHWTLLTTTSYSTDCLPPSARCPTLPLSPSDGQFDANKLRLLRPCFKENGTVTAGNASAISDGAAAVVLASRQAARQHGLNVLAVLRGFGDAEQAPNRFTTAPALAVPVALKHAGVEQSEVDYWEINEAFSVVALANQKLLGIPEERLNVRGDPVALVVALANQKLLNIPEERLNVHGGAVALGHPLGSSGARIVVSLLGVLRKHEGRLGVAAVCNGGGGASALVVQAE
ncbi:unnamed protein product [Closterium sp. NIES-64]|nr:unnamed protein product [Closterium sp. NIES-64]